MVLGVVFLQSEANDKFNELEEQLQQIKDQIKVCVHVLTNPIVTHMLARLEHACA
jgi:hypothetical protein